MGELARRVEKAECLKCRYDPQRDRHCYADDLKHPECAVAVFKTWLEEQEGRLAERLPQSASLRSIVGPVPYRAKDIAHDAVAALVSALEEWE